MEEIIKPKPGSVTQLRVMTTEISRLTDRLANLCDEAQWLIYLEIIGGPTVDSRARTEQYCAEKTAITLALNACTRTTIQDIDYDIDAPTAQRIDDSIGQIGYTTAITKQLLESVSRSINHLSPAEPPSIKRKRRNPRRVYDSYEAALAAIIARAETKLGSDPIPGTFHARRQLISSGSIRTLLSYAPPRTKQKRVINDVIDGLIARRYPASDLYSTN